MKVAVKKALLQLDVGRSADMAGPIETMTAHLKQNYRFVGVVLTL